MLMAVRLKGRGAVIYSFITGPPCRLVPVPWGMIRDGWNSLSLCHLNSSYSPGEHKNQFLGHSALVKWQVLDLRHVMGVKMEVPYAELFAVIFYG